MRDGEADILKHGLTLWQPWAHLVAVGVKQHETRSWRPPASIIGKWVAIHAGLRKAPEAKELIKQNPNVAEFCAKLGGIDAMPYGAIVGVARVVGVEVAHLINVSPLERSLGDYRPGRFAWPLSEAKLLAEPVQCMGGQRIFKLPPRARKHVLEQLKTLT